MSRERNVELVQAGVEAFNRGDEDAVVGVFAPDVNRNTLVSVESPDDDHVIAEIHQTAIGARQRGAGEDDRLLHARGARRPGGPLPPLRRSRGGSPGGRAQLAAGWSPVTARGPGRRTRWAQISVAVAPAARGL